MSQQQRSASALGGRSARACDNCGKRRARWYCAPDDAFLCQPCDSSVHSANPLASRHDRVRLNTTSMKSPSTVVPAWHHSFTRKPRTPRKQSTTINPKPALIVPDLDIDVDTIIEEEQLLYRVPIFDPALAEFCSPPPLDDSSNIHVLESKGEVVLQQPDFSDILCAFQPNEMEMAEFAADVESLLGQGFDEDQFCMEALGLMDVREDDINGEGFCNFSDDGCVKLEFATDVGFDCQSSGEERIEYSGEGKVESEDELVGSVEGENDKRVMLRLDYEGVVSAWSSQGCSPWIDGQRPQLSHDLCWPDYTGMYGEVGQMATGTMDVGREARVMRYREKRRTRLFSKKIRYEVRKLNAEKRPRMKGRFVKRSSAAAGSFPY